MKMKRVQNESRTSCQQTNKANNTVTVSCGTAGGNVSVNRDTAGSNVAANCTPSKSINRTINKSDLGAFDKRNACFSAESQQETAEQIEREAAASMRALAREFESCRDMLVALGNENRQVIFIALLDNPGGVRVGDLAEMVQLSRPATSHHLKVLKDAGLVEWFKVGTKNYYHASSRLDRWRQLAQLTSRAETFVRGLVALESRGLSPCPSVKRRQKDE